MRVMVAVIPHMRTVKSITFNRGETEMNIDFDSYMLSALEVDKINRECPDLTPEEQEIHDKLTEE